MSSVRWQSRISGHSPSQRASGVACLSVSSAGHGIFLGSQADTRVQTWRPSPHSLRAWSSEQPRDLETYAYSERRDGGRPAEGARTHAGTARRCSGRCATGTHRPGFSRALRSYVALSKSFPFLSPRLTSSKVEGSPRSRPSRRVPPREPQLPPHRPPHPVLRDHLPGWR